MLSESRLTFRGPCVQANYNDCVFIVLLSCVHRKTMSRHIDVDIVWVLHLIRYSRNMKHIQFCTHIEQIWFHVSRVVIFFFLAKSFSTIGCQIGGKNEKKWKRMRCQLKPRRICLYNATRQVHIMVYFIHILTILYYVLYYTL